MVAVRWAPRHWGRSGRRRTSSVVCREHRVACSVSQPATPTNAARNAYSTVSRPPSEEPPQGARSVPQWATAVCRAINHERCGTTPSLRRNFQDNRKLELPHGSSPFQGPTAKPLLPQRWSSSGCRYTAFDILADGLNRDPRNHRDERAEQPVLDDVLACFLTNEATDETFHGLLLHILRLAVNVCGSLCFRVDPPLWPVRRPAAQSMASAVCWCGLLQIVSNARSCRNPSAFNDIFVHLQASISQRYIKVRAEPGTGISATLSYFSAALQFLQNVSEPCSLRRYPNAGSSCPAAIPEAASEHGFETFSLAETG